MAKVYILSCVCSMIMIYVSAKMKSSWSGDGFSSRRLRIAFVFMMVCGGMHFKYAYTGQIMFSDIVDQSPLRLVAFLLGVAHSGCLPIEGRKNTKFSAQKKDIIHLRPPRPPTVNRYEELFFHVLQLVFLIVLVATGCTVMIAGPIVMIFSISPDYMNYLVGTVFFSSVIMCIVLLYRTHKKGGRNL